MSYKFDRNWYERAQALTFEEVLSLSDINPELKLYETEFTNKTHVLDLGVGFGSDTVYFLSRGSIVDSVDSDKNVLNILKKKCIKFNKNLCLLNLKLPNISFKRKYDVIIVSNILHYLNFSEIESIIKILVSSLNQNGYIVFRSHSKKHPYNSEHHPKKNVYKYFFSKDDLKLFFPSDNFTPYYISEYYRKYNKKECVLYGYDSEIENYKYSITAIFKKNG